MDKNKLKALLYDDCKQSFEHFIAEHGRENLIGFGLCSSEGYPNVGIIGATREAQARDGDPKRFRFVTEEWDLMPADVCKMANNLLYDTYQQGLKDEEKHPHWFAEYRDRTAAACVEVFEQLATEGFFGKGDACANLFVMFGVFDSMIPFEAGVDWSQRLNYPQLHAEYAAFAEQVREQDWY